MSVTVALVGIIARAIRARRVLEIGTGAGSSSLAIAAALPPDGMLITLEREETVALAARQAVASAGYANRVSVMIGDAARYLHKIAGPFDLVVQDGDVAQYRLLHERLVSLLAPSGTLLTFNVDQAGDYNEMLAADVRLTTFTLNLDGGVAISVKHKDVYDA